jgi:DNA-binding transcriptional MerR regulator
MSNGEREPPTEAVWLDDTGSGRADPPSERVLSIENVAKMFGVSKLSLRYYEFRGLIRRMHSLGGVPVFSWADCERLAFIIKCRKAGVKLSDLVTIIDATDDDASPLAFKTGQENCMALVERLERRRRVIDEALAELSHVFALLTTKLLGDAESSRRE